MGGVWKSTRTIGQVGHGREGWRIAIGRAYDARLQWRRPNIRRRVMTEETPETPGMAETPGSETLKEIGESVGSTLGRAVATANKAVAAAKPEVRKAKRKAKKFAKQVRKSALKAKKSAKKAVAKAKKTAKRLKKKLRR